jgi:hypothetical protein
MQTRLAQVRAQAAAMRDRVQQQNAAAHQGASGATGSARPPQV